MATKQRSQWGSRAGFIMAAVGSAIGLGNIWRFPYIAYENGGGAFFIPYLIALLTAGIPILILEFTLGNRYKGSSPLSMARLNKKSEVLGWWQVVIAFFISTYYAVIIAWSLSFTYFSFNLSWGDNTKGFLLNDYLKVSAPGELGQLVPDVLFPLIIVWLLVLGTLYKGVKKGIEAANRIFIPTLVVIFLIIVVRAVTLDGALMGLNALFEPDWSKIAHPDVWIAAYGQIFFSLSIAFAIMITYSSYLPKGADINNNAFIAGFSNTSFELLAGIGVFSALGFMAKSSGIPVSEVATDGVILAFSVFPAIISQMPVMSELFGILFFLSLTLAGMTSLISISETYIAGLQDKFKISRRKAVTFGGGLAAIISLLYATQGGLFLLDVVDHFVLSLGVVVSGLIEIILVGWVFKELHALQRYANEVSDLRTGKWWILCLKFLTPVLLGYMLISAIIQEFQQPYEGYPTSFLLTFGVGAVALTIAIAIFMTLRKWRGDASTEQKEVH